MSDRIDFRALGNTIIGAVALGAGIALGVLLVVILILGSGRLVAIIGAHT